MNNDDKTNEIVNFLNHSDVICQSKAPSKEAAIKELLALLAENHDISDVKEAFQSVMNRENTLNTIMPGGFALPHARLDGIDTLCLGIATFKEPIPFSDDLQEKVSMIIMILAPKDAPGLYLEVLSALSRVFSDSSLVEKVAKLKTSEEVISFFNRGGIILPQYVCAGDIMVKNPVALKEQDTLQKAIDLFVHHNLIDLPVVDKDSDLVGVVNGYALLKVCLPDYILWMDDMTPIMNFEPFSTVLRNESTTWLTEIMVHDYAVVSEDAPAMQVAKEITKYNSRQAYVLRDKKLVGVITLQHFLNKVLRE